MKKKIEKALYEYKYTNKKVAEILKDNNISEKTFYRNLSKSNVLKRKKIKESEEILREVYNYYSKNITTLSQACDKYNVSRSVFKRYIDKNNLKKNCEKVRHSYKEDCFSTLKTEEQAYWLGFLAADGCVVGNDIHLGLQAKDVEHIEKFIKFTTNDYEKVKISLSQSKTGMSNKCYQVAKVSIRNFQIVNDLKKLGISEQKSLTYVMPSCIPQKLMRHYLRGYFDGDGTITTSGTEKTGFQYYCLSLIATKEFCEQFMDILEPLNISKVKIATSRSSDKMFIWHKRGTNQIRIILDYLYKDASIYLDRKYQKYLEFCRLHPNPLKDVDY